MVVENKQIKLVLHDGSVFYGYSFGAKKSVSGEVVFNTGMVGYPETLTDPSYRGQILNLTYPLIGNYGVPDHEKECGLSKYFESDRIQAQGLIVSDYSKDYHHWNAKKSLHQWLKEFDVPGIYGVDTRELTKKLRQKGTMLGKIIYDKDVELEDPNERNLIAEASIKKPVIYKRGKIKALIIDCGCKNSIIRAFLKRNITIIRVPWDYDFLKLKFHGLLISNGPGDPKKAGQSIDNVRRALKKNIPTFGICLGNQILALAAGADTYKLKFGHRSQNQPSLQLGTERCYITTQNHGYAVKTKTLPKDWEPWFTNLNDKTNEGIRHKRKPFSSVQFHPEAYLGTADTRFLFDRFIRIMKNGKRA